MAKRQPTQPAEEIRPLNTLIEQPLQEFYSGGMGQYDLAALAADIAENGLREKITILPANKAGLPPSTILDGHKRRQALMFSGETTTTVIVRYDLAQCDALTAERTYLASNLTRGLDDQLVRMRKAWRLYEIEMEKPLSEQAIDGRRGARDRIGHMFGLSGRTLARLIRVLRAPDEVQYAFLDGHLPLILAEKVCTLESTDQLALAERLYSGDDAKAVVREYLPPRKLAPETVSPLEYPRLALFQ
jgi:ParB-like chromosome segregation protein Spo0J